MTATTTTELFYDEEPDEEPPTSELDVERRLLWLRDLREERDALEHRFDTEIARITERRKEAVDAIGSRIGWLEKQLFEYHAAVIRDAEEAGKKAPLTLKFAHGTFKSRAGRSTVGFDTTNVDYDTPMPWSETTHRASRSALLKAIKDGKASVVDDGRIVWSDGEHAGTFVDGATYREGTRSYSVDVS